MSQTPAITINVHMTRTVTIAVNALPIGVITYCIVYDRMAMRSFDLQSLQVL